MAKRQRDIQTKRHIVEETKRHLDIETRRQRDTQSKRHIDKDTIRQNGIYRKIDKQRARKQKEEKHNDSTFKVQRQKYTRTGQSLTEKYFKIV